jgi:hypothetical protein
MSDDLDWTTDLGDAEVNQRQDVAEVIQALRASSWPRIAFAVYGTII